MPANGLKKVSLWSLSSSWATEFNGHSEEIICCLWVAAILENLSLFVHPILFLSLIADIILILDFLLFSL